MTNSLKEELKNDIRAKAGSQIQKPKTMETAPKEGRILIYDDFQWITGEYSKENGYFEDDFGEDLTETATHWAYLPDKPNEAS